jgi:hypothetical protein
VFCKTDASDAFVFKSITSIPSLASHRLLTIMITNDNKIGAFLEWNTPRLVPISTFIKLYLNASIPPLEGLFSGQLKAPELGHKVNN